MRKNDPASGTVAMSPSLISMSPERSPRRTSALRSTVSSVAAAPGGQFEPVFSPDGRWIAYVSDESGRDEIYVQPYPGTGRKQRVSKDGGRLPVWVA